MDKKKKVITVSTGMDGDRGIAKFRIDIPYDFIMNENLLEVMAAYEQNDLAAWLETLANIVRNATERIENG